MYWDVNITVFGEDKLFQNVEEEQHILVLISDTYCDICRKDYFAKIEYALNQVEKLPRHINCCYTMFFKKEEHENNGAYSRKLTPLYRRVDVDKNKSNLNSKEEFELISQKGFIEYIGDKGQIHKVKVKCEESVIVEFGDENEIGKRLHPEECYQYQIVDNEGNIQVNIYKSK